MNNDEVKFDIMYTMKVLENIQSCHKIGVINILKNSVFHKMSHNEIVQKPLNDLIVEFC